MTTDIFAEELQIQILKLRRAGEAAAELLKRFVALQLLGRQSGRDA